MIYIGVDPDIEKSGYAYWGPESRYLSVSTWPFFDLLDTILSHWKVFNQSEDKMIVHLEAGWLNKPSNFRRSISKRVDDRISNKTGQNHAVGKLVERFLIRNRIPYKLIIPRSAKWDAATYKRITGDTKTRTNSEMRDAAKLVYGC
jgi:hypothetical protein